MNFMPAWMSRKPKLTPVPLTEQLFNAMRGEPKRVLFLEDDRLWRELVGVVAGDYDIQVIGVRTIAEAMRALNGDCLFDAAILDVTVANGNGIELYRWIRTAFPKMHVVFLTGAKMEQVADRIHTVGSAPVYHKPMVMTVDFLSDLLEKFGARRRCSA